MGGGGGGGGSSQAPEDSDFNKFLKYAKEEEEKVKQEEDKTQKTGLSYDPSSRKWTVNYGKTDYNTNRQTDLPETKTVDVVIGYELVNDNQQEIWGTEVVPDEKNIALNKKNAEINKKYSDLNSKNKQIYDSYQKILAVVNSTKGGDYLAQRQLIRNTPGINDSQKKIIEDNYKTYYITEKLKPWDINLGAKPPAGEFDPVYYKQQNPGVAQQWAVAVADDNIDITQRYSENSFYLSHYTNQGKPAGLRGNKPEELLASKQYIEERPTDKDLQDVRDIQLGINTDIDTESELSELEAAVKEGVGEKALLDVKKFGALRQDVLKQTIQEMKKAKAREQEMALFSGFDELGEITNINKDLTNSILGDSGIGGVLSFMGGKKSKESLEKSLRGITGINNEVTYNWQQWFDNALKSRYQEDLELGLTKEQAEEKVKIEGEFARKFIDDYLTPRFNESRSMNEFIEYIDVRQGEQNPFQTQDVLGASKLIADIRARQYIDQLKQTPERYFDSEFYFNPTGNEARKESYANQASTVAADWEIAKKGDPYWKSQAYRFGVNIDDKDAFARMHFQVKGQAQGYDAADDILNASKVSDEIYNRILPAIKKEALTQKTIFGPFLKPEEFADEMLKGVNPDDKTTWDEVLGELNLKDFAGDLGDLKDYISETLRTGSAQEIREKIKYLNKKKEKPTQENLGVTYIQREEDYKPVKTTGEETELYKTFQTAGFQGTEDEFYENFFPDVDRSEQIALTKAGTNQSLKTTGLDFSDPFASLGTIESFFSEAEDKTEEKPARSSYFTIDEDEDLPTKSKAGQGFLDEFTSLFKGLS
jgi:hypothetical protein